jgi:hypothetical protein
MTAAPPPLAPDLAAGLRRLKLAAMRQLAPKLLTTANTLSSRKSRTPHPRVAARSGRGRQRPITRFPNTYSTPSL